MKSYTISEESCNFVAENRDFARMEGQDKYDVFISYSRKDYVNERKEVIPCNEVSRIKETLMTAGISYWFDEEGIYSGQEFTSVITKAIRKSRVFVFISSKNSNASLWTSNEIAIAKRLNKPIIPYCLDDSPYNDSVMMLIAALDYIDGREADTALIKLTRAIGHYLGTEDETRTVSRQNKKRETIGGQIPWYEQLVNPSWSPLQKIMVYLQLCAYGLSLFFVIWTSLFGALAINHHFQLCQFLLMVTLVLSLFSTIKCKAGSLFWWAVILACDFLEVLYVSVLAKYLFVHWPTFSKLGMPTSMRYGWLYQMGQGMGDHQFMHPVLLVLAIFHVLLVCFIFIKDFRLNRKVLGSVALAIAILVPLIMLMKSNFRLRTWYSRMSQPNYPELDMIEISTGQLYGMHEAVDLGLSVKWATCNLGARTPYESGRYYAWGEAKTKEFFDRSTYKYGDYSAAGDKMTKYCTDSIYGVVDNQIVLCDSDDAAVVAWGDGWRMPTYDEISELKERCTFEIMSVSGTNGVVVTGPNKKKLFFPFAGDVEGQIPSGEGTYAILWSSSLSEENDYAFELAFSIANNLWFRGPRFMGHNIRAVHD